MEAPARKNVGDHIRQVGAYSILLTFFSLGVGLCSVFWSSTVSSLNQQITQSRNEFSRTTSELEKVKSEYFAYKTLHENKSLNSSDLNSSDVKASTIAKDSAHSNREVATPYNVETKRVDEGKSIQFFNNDLTISVVSLVYTASGYRVLANISSNNGKVKKMTDAEVGSVLEYESDKKYRITLLEAGAFGASFKVAIQK